MSTSLTFPGTSSGPNAVDQRRTFVRLLEEHKNALGQLTEDTKEGPNKLLARQMQVSPARIGNFLQLDYRLALVPKGERADDARLKKIVVGFAASVERVRLKLGLTGAPGADSLNTRAIVYAYWPSEFEEKFQTPLVTQAIQEGERISQRGFEKQTKLHVELWLSDWGPFDKPENQWEASFFFHYGRAVIRGIDPLETEIKAVKKTLVQTLEIPARTSRGDWAVAVGPYERLDRRFRALDFVTFPAIRYPLVGLVISSNEISPDLQLRFEFPFIGESTPESECLLDTHFRLPRFVAQRDEAGRRVLYSMFSDSKTAEDQGVNTLAGETAIAVAKLLIGIIDENRPTIVFLGDGVFVFEVFAWLVDRDVHLRVIPQMEPSPEFSFLGGMMFRQENHPLAELLESSQRQLFRTPRRVVGLIELFVREIDAWVTDLSLTSKAKRNWPKNAPLFIYPYKEVEAYLASCYLGLETNNKNLIEIAVGIFDRLHEMPPVKNPMVFERLFRSSEPSDERDARLLTNKERAGAHAYNARLK